MGVGAAACEPGTLSLIRQIYRTTRARARALGVWTSVSGVSLAVGPGARRPPRRSLAAGAASSGSTSASGSCALAAAAWTLPESSDPQGRSHRPPGPRHGRRRRLRAHLRGDRGRERRVHAPGGSTVLFALAAAAVVAFVVIERRARDPVLPLEYFRIPAYSTANAVAFATSFGLFAVFFFTALYLQVDAQLLAAGGSREQFVAMAVAMVVGRARSRDAGRSARGPRVADGRSAACSPAAASSLVDRILLKPTVAKVALAAALALVGFGLGLALVAVTSAVLDDRARRALGHGRLHGEHEPRARRRARGGDPRRGDQRRGSSSELEREARARSGSGPELPAARRPRRHARRPAGRRAARDPHEPGAWPPRWPTRA